MSHAGCRVPDHGRAGPAGESERCNARDEECLFHIHFSLFLILVKWLLLGPSVLMRNRVSPTVVLGYREMHDAGQADATPMIAVKDRARGASTNRLGLEATEYCEEGQDATVIKLSLNSPARIGSPHIRCRTSAEIGELKRGVFFEHSTCRVSNAWRPLSHGTNGLSKDPDGNSL